MLIVHYHLVQLPRTWKDDTEVLLETNEQKKDNVHVGYENNSNEVQPNSRTDLNLSGMNNNHSSEWDSLMQYKSTAWKVSKYGVISGSYFPVFQMNTEKYGPEITP